MKVVPRAYFICPLDDTPLMPGDGWIGCAAGHRYDGAREGYFNLLPVQYKASRDPGDDKAMVAARRRVVDSGVFTPLADAVFDFVRTLAMHRSDRVRPLRVVDAGCGEGYILAHLQRRAAACDDADSLELAGYDISKWAVRAAARHGTGIAWAVASNRQPPIEAASVDLLLSQFGFPHWPAFEMMLASCARLLTVDADSAHLMELRQVIYPQVDVAEVAPVPEALARGWQLLSERRLNYAVTLDTPQRIQDLIAMTPHAHRMLPDGRAALDALKQAEVTMNMVMREWQPPHGEVSPP